MLWATVGVMEWAFRPVSQSTGVANGGGCKTASPDYNVPVRGSAEIPVALAMPSRGNAAIAALNLEIASMGNGRIGQSVSKQVSVRLEMSESVAIVAHKFAMMRVNGLRLVRDKASVARGLWNPVASAASVAAVFSACGVNATTRTRGGVAATTAVGSSAALEVIGATTARVTFNSPMTVESSACACPMAVAES